MKNRSLFTQSFCAQILCGLLLAVVAVGLTACETRYYKFPTYTFADRPVPPSKLDSRVMVGVTVDGTSQGKLEILDGKRDLRNSIFNPNSTFSISGYSAAYPSQIFNFPEQISGFVYSRNDGSLNIIDYGTEAVKQSAGTLPANVDSIAVPDGFGHVYAASSATGQLAVIDIAAGRTYALNLPNVYRVAANTGDTTVLAMVRNSNLIYRLVKLNSAQTAVPGSIDCQPQTNPVYCVVPVPDSTSTPTFDRPVGAYFSIDGSTAYVLNCGQECGGKTSSLTMMQTGALLMTTYPTSASYTSPVTGSIAVPGGATVALSDGSTLYVAGQQLQTDGLFAGNLTTIDEASKTVTGTYSISDGNHSKLLFADNNTLWIGSQSCATGERAAKKQNYNCLTRFDRTAKTAAIVPAVDPTNSASSVPYPNSNENQYYYGDLTGICWVQNQFKVYSAYGGQIHAFNTTDGSEINNSQITVQGTALDVAYLDALTNDAN
ncbi:MAG: hypothetical protein PW789_13380 [Edaphobacter sp.]|uniref:hypothetical protein n=1 Tax=Edaphobacter sp. TaxID=1934404 RepID=UPI0023A08315|nr:hypothetical protein [Edaphobacter sp.]MDE1177576.1 hypothetical protein [Edaphobacter sp.]